MIVVKKTQILLTFGHCHLVVKFWTKSLSYLFLLEQRNHLHPQQELDLRSHHSRIHDRYCPRCTSWSPWSWGRRGRCILDCLGFVRQPREARLGRNLKQGISIRRSIHTAHKSKYLPIFSFKCTFSCPKVLGFIPISVMLVVEFYSDTVEIQ